jgi:hypothetical protein
VYKFYDDHLDRSLGGRHKIMGSLVQKQCVSILELNLWFLPRIAFVVFTTTSLCA